MTNTELVLETEDDPRLTNRDRRYMEFVRRHAIDVEPIRSAKLAALVTVKGTPISIGRNSLRSHPFQAKYSRNEWSIYLHAEINAIYNCLNHLDKDDFKKATLYIARVKKPHNRSREWADGCACPCEGCMRAITEFDFRKIVYTTDVTNKYEILERKDLA